jgi:hypothetical protein
MTSKAIAAIKLDLQKDTLLIKHEKNAFPISLSCPRFEFEAATVGVSAPTAIKGDLASGAPITVFYAPLSLGDAGKLQVILYLQWSAEEAVLHKWASYRLVDADAPLLLKEVALEEIDTTQPAPGLGPWQAVITVPMSYPIFFSGLFAGIEFPVASTRREEGRAILAHMPGKTLEPGAIYETRKAVYGVCPTGEERRAFQAYVVDRSPAGIRRFFIYEPWVCVPLRYTEAHHLEFVSRIADNLYKKHGVSVDTCIMTAGWSDPQHLYEIDPGRFPTGYDKINQATKAMGANLGTWISPAALYSFAVDHTAKEGYETTLWANAFPGCCMGGPKYQARFKARLVDMFSRYDMVYSYMDGVIQQCPETDHGHAPDQMSAEAIAEGLIDVVQAVRTVNPQAWLEATCFGGNASPWWLFYYNTVLGNYGNDYCWGRVPAPVYRDSHTTARDYHNLQGLVHGLLPAPLQEVFGGFNNHTDDPGVNDAAMGIMRGNLLYMLSSDPKMMDDYIWAGLARLITWARNNTAIFRDTRPLLPASWQNGHCPVFTLAAPMPRESYGYAQWEEKRGLVTLRNPWITHQEYELPLGENTGLAPAAAGLSVVSLYPENRIYATGLKYGDILRVPLAPYEMVVLAIEPTAPAMPLPKPADQIGHRLQVSDLCTQVSIIEFEGETETIGPDWICPVGNTAQSLEVKLAATVTLAAPQGELLVLVEEPPQDSVAKIKPVIDPLYRVTVNGQEVAPTYSGINLGYVAETFPQPEAWLFLRFPLTTGQNKINLELTTRNEDPTLSIFAWATKPGVVDGSTYPNSLPQPEHLSLDAITLLAPVTLADTVLSTRHAERAQESIAGLFLDTLAPEVVAGSVSTNTTPDKTTALSVRGRQYLRGLGVVAPTHLRFNLAGKYKTFQAQVGVDVDPSIGDRAVVKSIVAFSVVVDGEVRWTSPDRTFWDEPLPVDVDITNAKTLELVAEDHSLTREGEAPSWADWAEAKLLQ